MEPAKILVVEDENIVAKDIATSLKRLGYAVPAVTSSGEEAVERTVDTDPDLVLMDIVLRGKMDGVQTAQHIHDHFNIPVVYLT
ncbi:response regulator, partial [bacterium]|nr:response regulator [bacterium]